MMGKRCLRSGGNLVQELIEFLRANYPPLPAFKVAKHTNRSGFSHELSMPLGPEVSVRFPNLYRAGATDENHRLVIFTSKSYPELVAAFYPDSQKWVVPGADSPKFDPFPWIVWLINQRLKMNT